MLLVSTCALTACSSKDQQKTADAETSSTTSITTAPPPKSEPEPTPDASLRALTETDLALCESLNDGVNYALLNHIEYGPSDKTEVLQKGFARWMKQTQKDGDRGAAVSVDLSSLNTMCAHFMGTSEQLFQEFSEETDEAINPLDFHTFQTNYLLESILQQMDPFSSIHIDTDSAKNESGYSLPIPLYHRSDYNWRKPSYLVVNPSYNGDLDLRIQPWSVILGINDIDISQHSFSNLRDKLFSNMGEESQVTFTLPGGQTPQTIRIESTVRDLELPYVLGHAINDRTVYVKILNVDNEANHDLLHRLLSLGKETPTDVILDVRGNPGGGVAFAKKMTSFFLPPKSPQFVLEFAHYNAEKQEKEFTQSLETYTDYYADPVWERFGKVLVLMDRTSASASELIVSSLQSNKRVFVLGERSFGKFFGQNTQQIHTGATQILFPIKLTQLRSFGFQQNEQGQWSFSTWQNGLTPDAEVLDPVLEHLERNREALTYGPAFRMSDYDFRLSPKPRQPITFEPEILVPTELQVLSEEKDWLGQQAQQIQKNTPSCAQDALPDTPKFREEDECIYQVGLELMKQWQAGPDAT
jgi:C-terminal processing protease CtpA/Prc